MAQMALDLNNLDPTNPPRPYLTFDEAIELFQTQEVLYCDTESNGKEVRDGRGYLTGVSLAAGSGDHALFSTYMPFRHREGPNYDNVRLAELKRQIEKYEGHLVFHNYKFDHFNMLTAGINHRGPFYDTMLMSHLTNENLYSQALDSLALSRIKREGKKKTKEFQGFLKVLGWEEIPSYVMFEYACVDAELLVPLLDNIMVDFEKEELHDHWKHKQEFLRDVVIPMESRGVRIDTELCKLMITLGESAMLDIMEILGLNPGSRTDQKILFIDRLGLPVLKRGKPTAKYPQGDISFDKEVMEQYEEILEHRHSDPTAEFVLAYRGWQKSVSSNYKAYLDLLSPDGRLRPNYKLHGTKTGRSSCEKPNLQQIPRNSTKPWNGATKTCFIASAGYQLWEADYAQLELRLGTAYAKEEKLIEVFADPERDVFNEMAAQLGMERFPTKTLTYSMQYGAGVNRIKNVFNVSPERAQAIRDNYFKTYPRFEIITKHAARRAIQHGKVQIWTKRFRHFMFPKSESHKAFNAVIQGGAADIVERTMVRLVRNGFNNDECRMLLTVHDSIVFEIKEGKESYYLPRIKEIMEDVKSIADFGVTFKVDIHKWGES